VHTLSRAASHRKLLATLMASAALALLLALPAPGKAAPRSLTTGFTDFVSFQFNEATDRQFGFQQARSAGASMIRLTFNWDQLAPNAPPNIATTANPSWSGYDWSREDTAIKEAVAAGVKPLFLITQAPRWAEGPGRPSSQTVAPYGSWRPSAPAFQALATALAKRYSGTFPDPANPGQALPRVIYWQGWNEPNLLDYVSPQWKRSGGKLVPESPNIYRGLLNAWYRGLKSVSANNVVVTAGTSPFGDLGTGGRRIPPALFYRELFCLRGRQALKRFHCADSPVRFDVLAHHPYPIGPPRRHAPNPDDVVIADWNRLKRPLKVALKDHTVAPNRSKQLWATEFSWDTNPPDPKGIPTRLEATYMEGALNTLWEQGVNTALWFLMVDDPPDPDFASTLQSGIFLRGATPAQDTPKPSFTAFSFPFTAYIHRGKAQLWGLAPAPGPVTIQRQAANGSWTQLTKLQANASRLFVGDRRVRAGTTLRAVQGSRISLSWKVFTPGK
jgi:hypothetical protein